MTVSDSFTHLLDSFPEPWRPKVGDKVIGLIISLESRTTEYGEYPIVILRTDEGQDFAVHAFHTVARRELEKLQPRLGDRIGIAYHGPHPTKGYERYRIVIARDMGVSGLHETPSSAQDDTGDEGDGIPY